MNIPPRFVRFMPEVMRELYALPRWWVMMFTLLSFAPFAVIITIRDPFSASVSISRIYASCYHFLHIATLVGAVVLGSIGGGRLVNDLALDPLARRELGFLRLLDRILASCVHVYMFFVGSLPCVALFLWLAPRNELRRDIISSLIWIESSFLFTAVFMFVLSALTRTGWRTLATSELFPVFFVFLVLIIFAYARGGFINRLFGLPFIPFQEFHDLDDSIRLLPRWITGAFKPELWLAGILQQIAIGTALLFFVRDVLRVRRGFLLRRSTYFIIISVFAWSFALNLWKYPLVRFNIPVYLIWAGIAILLSPLFVAPGHEQLRVRSLFVPGRSRWERMFSPYAASYITILCGTLIFVLPIILGYFDGGHGRTETKNIILTSTTALSLFYIWACFFTALVEHCSLYVRHRGRLLAFLVALLFILAPLIVLSTGPLRNKDYLDYVSPFYYSFRITSSRFFGNIAPYITQLSIVASAAIGLQLWTDHQRKKRDRIQHARLKGPPA